MAPSYEIETTTEKAEALQQLGFNLREIQTEQSQIAEPDRKDWIIVPQEFSGWEYKLIVNPARLSYNPALEKAAKELGVNDKNTARDSLGRDFIGRNNWQESLKLNLSLGNKTLNLEESTTFGRLLLSGIKGKGRKVYDTSGKPVENKILEQYFNDIYQVKSPWRAEWLDADFKYRDGKLYLYQNHILNKEGNLSPRNRRLLTKNTLMQNKTPGISLEDWLENPTRQGLPTNKIQNGDSYYWAPLNNNNSVARLAAYSDRFGLFCGALPSNTDSDLGVRAAKRLD